MYDLLYAKLDVLVVGHKPHDYVGSSLRGAFGYALKSVVCINPHFKCEGCFAKDNCLFYEFYEIQNKPHSYRFAFELKDKAFRFSIYLFEEAAKKIPYIVSAITKMLTENGIGSGRKLYPDFYITQHELQTFKCDTYYPNITIRLLTPLKINNPDKMGKLGLFDVLWSVWRRYGELKSLPKSNIPWKIDGKTIGNTLTYHKLERFSGRQNIKMNMSGFIGDIEVQGIDKQSYKLLKLGEILGSGKQSVMGLGNFILLKGEQ